MKRMGRKILIRPYEMEDAAALLEVNVNNREFFQKYLSHREEEFYTLDHQIERIKRGKEMRAQDQVYSFGIFERESEQLVGSISLTEVLRGPLQSCFIGYYLDEKCNGRGYMTEAVRLVVEYAFQELKLHRIEAGVMLHNLGSMRVLENAGFHKEGIAKKNVKINGRWEDHQVLAIVNEED
ncbi:GNAT family N-acetyltransferase [Tumebacillus lipolyticus]|uniref:GNAT family N-acetyltransferase n=1 Tax=Tumebacillus lipolyticus TaxID=1280370 RepID=A0ABW4ZX28_9BACL